ncbi:MAG: PilZ domain-containing protein [Myxococcales bacterium]|nr:PilZ domain-containing protein [Myxococcales bacterium]
MLVLLQRPDFLLEKRSNTRHPVSIDTTVTFQEKQSKQTIVSISLGGALLTFGERLPIGTRLDVVFLIPTAESEISVGAIVRWVAKESLGVQFDGLRARDVWSLNEYFRNLEE